MSGGHDTSEGKSPVARRSLLSVPGSNPDMIEKALATDADSVMLDLEDAVAPDSKTEARQKVIRSLTNELDRREKAVLCRVNALDTAYFYRDLVEVVEEAGHAFDAALVPKVNRPEDIYVVDTLLSQIEAAIGLDGKMKIEAQIESAAGLANVDAIACASDRLEALHFGPGDYAASVGMPQTSIGTMDEWDRSYPGHRFHYAMHRILVAARTAGIRALDGPVADYRDEEGLRESCVVARSLGFDGKWCIHPAQIGTVNEVFSPTCEEIEWARKVMEAYEKANATGSGSVSVEGQMVDAASIRMARNTLNLEQG